MIARLRSRHRWMTLGMALAAPAVLVAGVMARPDWEARLDSPASPELSIPAGESVSLDSTARRFGKVDLQLVHVSSDARAHVLRIERLRGGEILDYWLYATESVGAGITRLPEDAQLLGSLEGAGPWDIELEGPSWPAALVLYETGTARVADVLLQPGPGGE